MINKLRHKKLTFKCFNKNESKWDSNNFHKNQGRMRTFALKGIKDL